MEAPCDNTSTIFVPCALYPLKSMRVNLGCQDGLVLFIDWVFNGHSLSCYIMAGIFTWCESGDRSARTKQEGKSSECKLWRVTWQLLMTSGYPKSKTKENLERTGLRGQRKGRFNSLDSLCHIGTKKSSLRLQATWYAWLYRKMRTMESREQ